MKELWNIYNINIPTLHYIHKGHATIERRNRQQVTLYMHCSLLPVPPAMKVFRPTLV